MNCETGLLPRPIDILAANSCVCTQNDDYTPCAQSFCMESKNAERSFPALTQGYHAPRFDFSKGSEMTMPVSIGVSYVADGYRQDGHGCQIHSSGSMPCGPTKEPFGT